MGRFGSPGLTGVDLICNKDIYTSALVPQHFFIVLFVNLIHVFASCLSTAFVVVQCSTACCVPHFVSSQSLEK